MLFKLLYKIKYILFFMNLSLCFAMEPAPEQIIDPKSKGSDLTPCKIVLKSVYKELKIPFITQEEIDQKIKEIGSGEPGYDIGLFQAQLYIDFDRGLNVDRTRCYILKKIQDMLTDFNGVIAKGQAYIENKNNEQGFIKKHMEKAKCDFDYLFQEMKEGRKEKIKPKIIEYFGLKLSFLADLAENPKLVYGLVNSEYNIINGLDYNDYFPKNKKIETIKNILEKDFVDSFLVNRFEKSDFWCSFSGNIKNILHSDLASFGSYNPYLEFFNKTIPIYSSSGIFGIHTAIYCLLNGYHPLALSPNPYPVHNNTFDNLRVQILDHDYQHMFDVIQKTRATGFMNTPKYVTTFFPSVFKCFEQIYINIMSKCDLYSRKRDMILLFLFLHENTMVNKDISFYDDTLNYLDGRLVQKRFLLEAPYKGEFSRKLSSGPHIHQFIKSLLLEGIDFVDLFKRIGIAINSDLGSFYIPPKTSKANFRTEIKSNLKRIEDFNVTVARNLTYLWYDFMERHAQDLKPLEGIVPDIFKKEDLNLKSYPRKYTIDYDCDTLADMDTSED